MARQSKKAKKFVNDFLKENKKNMIAENNEKFREARAELRRKKKLGII